MPAAFFVAAARVRTRKGAELSKRASVCQRSSQGAQAPQRTARAERGRDSLPRHLELTRAPAKGSFSFTEGSCGKCIPESGVRMGRAFLLRPLVENASQIPRLERDAFCEQTGHAFRPPTSGAYVHFDAPSRARLPGIPPTFAPLYRPFGRLSARAGILKPILFLCNTMQVRPARFEGGRDGEDSRR